MPEQESGIVYTSCTVCISVLLVAIRWHTMTALNWCSYVSFVDTPTDIKFFGIELDFTRVMSPGPYLGPTDTSCSLEVTIYLSIRVKETLPS